MYLVAASSWDEGIRWNGESASRAAAFHTGYASMMWLRMAYRTRSLKALS